MAKVIFYKIVSSERNIGTEDEPNIEQIILGKKIICPTQAIYDANYPIVEKEAVPGTIEVSGEFDEEDTTPTQLDRVEAQVTYTAMMTDTLLEV